MEAAYGASDPYLDYNTPEKKKKKKSIENVDKIITVKCWRQSLLFLLQY